MKVSLTKTGIIFRHIFSLKTVYNFNERNPNSSNNYKIFLVLQNIKFQNSLKDQPSYLYRVLQKAMFFKPIFHLNIAQLCHIIVCSCLRNWILKKNKVYYKNQLFMLKLVVKITSTGGYAILQSFFHWISHTHSLLIDLFKTIKCVVKKHAL